MIAGDGDFLAEGRQDRAESLIRQRTCDAKSLTTCQDLFHVQLLRRRFR